MSIAPNVLLTPIVAPAKEDKKLLAQLMQAAIPPAVEWAKEKEAVLLTPIAAPLIEGEGKKVALPMQAAPVLPRAQAKRKKVALPTPAA